MKKYTLLVIVVTLLNFLSGCATTDLKTVDVSSIDFSLHQLFSKQRSTIELGGRYRVKVIATTADGKVISNPDLSGVVVSSPNQSFSIIKHTPNKIEVLATSNALAMLNKKVYVLDVGLPDERAGVNQRKSFNVNWEAVKRVNYSGEDGQDGGSGGNAGDLTVYYVGQEVMNFIRPDVSGGRGGEGGQGGDGGSWGGSDGLGGHHGRFNKIQISKEAFIDKVQQGMSEEVLKRLQF